MPYLASNSVLSLRRRGSLRRYSGVGTLPRKHIGNQQRRGQQMTQLHNPCALDARDGRLVTQEFTEVCWESIRSRVSVRLVCWGKGTARRRSCLVDYVDESGERQVAEK